MIREALNTQPRVFARYEFGREKVEDLSGEWRKEKRREWLDVEVRREESRTAELIPW